MAKKKKGLPARPAAAKRFESHDEMIVHVDELKEPVNEVGESGGSETVKHDHFTENSETRDLSIRGYSWPFSTYRPQQLKSDPADTVDNPSASVDDINTNRSRASEFGDETQAKLSFLVARCRMCTRMAWLQSPSRNLVEVVLSQTDVANGMVLMTCARCAERNPGSDKTTSLDIHPEAWTGADMLQVAKSLTGLQMRMLGRGQTRTAVINLLALTQSLRDDEIWGEVDVERYRHGKRGPTLRLGSIKGGLI